MIDWPRFVCPAPETIDWDVIVVGAGLGGSVAGLVLARHGRKVLFLERGMPGDPFHAARSGSGLGRALHRLGPDLDRAARGRWPNRLTLQRRERRVEFYPPMGSGPGGSSAIYGAALERLRRVDFEPTAAPPDPAPLPDGWPLDFEGFARWYDEAEALFGVRGTRDPADPDDRSTLLAPPALGPRDAQFFDSFVAAGLAPYRVHVGLDYKPGCAECLGLLCPRDCKAEGASRALYPALSRHGAAILFGCTVDRLEADERRVDAVIARHEGREIRLAARHVILAAGALISPSVLLNSRSPRWPNGIGNDHDLVGRGLMFHVSDLFALFPVGRLAASGPSKTLASRAFYRVDGARLGEFQSVGLPIAPGAILEFLEGWWARTLPGRIRPPGPALLAAALVGARLMGRAALFATIMEDLPYAANRVVPDEAAPSGVVIHYERMAELDRRAALMRRLLRRHLGRHRPVFLSGRDNLNYGHPSGTCRFGADPATSVLTPDNQLRGIDNLHVVDASFLPTSGGANPSLTIAANALRVGTLLAAGGPA